VLLAHVEFYAMPSRSPRPASFMRRISTSSERPAPVRRVEALQRELSGVRVLVVDDNDDSLDLVCLALRRAGAEVRAAQSAEEARRILLEFAATVLVSDLAMPNESGYELMRRIRATEDNGVRLASIALSANTRPEDREEAYAAGFSMHVAKPVDLFGLIAQIGALARGDRLH
jgi:CheY-like chemotaxis protein